MSYQYQVPYAEIEKGICYFLTTKTDKGFTANEILAGILKENICPELNSKINRFGFNTEFSEHVENTSMTLSKIKRIGNQYMFSTKTINLDDVKAIILQPSDYPSVSFDGIYADGQTILHILCINGLYQYIEIVSQVISIDPHMRNEAGQTLFDVVPQTGDGHQTFRTLFNIFLTQDMLRTESKMKLVNDSNSALTKKNGELVLVNSELLITNKKVMSQNDALMKELVKYKQNIKSKNTYSFFKSVFIVILFAYIIYQNV